MAALISTPPPAEASIDDALALAHKRLQVIAADRRLTMQLVMDLWDCLTHCAEPELYHETTDKLQEALKREVEKIVTEAPKLSPETSNLPPSEKANEWEGAGVYQIERNDDGTPIPDPDWPAAFHFVMGVTPDGEPYFQLFKSEIEASLIDTTDTIRTELAVPELMNNDHYVHRFNKRYVFGRSAYDIEGKLISKDFNPMLTFNYAEHALMGNKVDLKFGDSQIFNAADHPLKLKNNQSLTYGEISALGGDFFGTFVPIMRGKTFEEQCELFRKAYATLAEAPEGVIEADKIRAILKTELDDISKITDNGTKTADTLAEYRRLKASDKALSDEDKSLNDATHRDGRPSYLAIAQLNLDHFSQGAVAAYNAGHYCAMKAAKESTGDLSTAYAMNAFADHFLGDSFASGHFRTPRQVLHGSDSDVQGTIDRIVYLAAGAGYWDLVERVAKEILDIHSSLVMTLVHLAPDLCAKYMHDEDNILGLWVKNSRHDQWQMFGDAKMFAPENQVNAKFMQQALKVSADEVWTAFENKSEDVPLPPSKDHPSSTAYKAWDIAPRIEVTEKNHQPLFSADGLRRKPWDDRNSTDRNWWLPGIYLYWALDFAENPDYFSKLK